MSKQSKFATLIEEARKEEQEVEGTEEATTTKEAPGPNHPPAPPIEATSRVRARPKGKRSDPSFEQVSARIPGQLNDRVRVALRLANRKAGRKKDFSELMAELLSGWLDSQGAD